jgi:hypothetical protein
MRPRLLCVLLLLAGPLIASAHIGEQNVIYEGLAGPYPVRVIIRPPDVVPGLAEISVRILQGSATRVTVLPVRYDTGSKGAPAPDLAEPVRGEPNLYNAQLWLMMSGAHSIFVNVQGSAGAGTTVGTDQFRGRRNVSRCSHGLEARCWYSAFVLLSA